MSCVLRATGTNFDVDTFLSASALKAIAVFRRGQPTFPSVASSPVAPASRFHASVSEAGFSELTRQFSDAINFLNEHRDELARLVVFPGVETVALDCGSNRNFPPCVASASRYARHRPSIYDVS